MPVVPDALNGGGARAILVQDRPTCDIPSARPMQLRQTMDEMAATHVQSSKRSVRFWTGWALALALSSLIVALATLPPFVGAGFRDVLMQGFSMVCHQLPARSPHVGDVSLAVCHRCYGIYLGLPLAVLGFLTLARWDCLLDRYARFILPASLAPAGIDWGLGVLGVVHNTPVSRLATGALFGIVAGYYLARALTEAFTAERPGPPSPASKDHAALAPVQAPGS